jgi:hypothetical protein
MTFPHDTFLAKFIRASYENSVKSVDWLSSFWCETAEGGKKERAKRDKAS